MAARRLVVVMLVLLGLSTLVAALVPTPDSHRGDSTATTGGGAKSPSSPPATPRPEPARTVNARLTVSRAAPHLIRVKTGQRLVLLVGGPVGDDISIPAFGLTETMTPQAPAHFDLIVDRAGRFPVRAFGADRVVGTIVSKSQRRQS
jgi:hypothetical protein